MADTQTLPKNIKKEKVEELRRAFGYFYDEDPNHIYKAKGYTDPITKEHYENSAELIDELWDLGIPKETAIKKIGIIIVFFDNFI
jgi:hypothetical protein